MNLKKIGLTALAGSLVATSLVAGEMSVTGAASLKVRHVDTNSAGKAFSMGNQLDFVGSGEMDNGIDVKLSFALDQGDDSTTGLKNSPFDSHSLSLGSDSLGTIVFHGEGGSSAQTKMDTTAAGDLWDNGYGVSLANDPKTSATGNNMFFYTLPTLVDDLALTASYTPRGGANTAIDSSSAFGIAYTGVEGLVLNYAQGENNSKATDTGDATTMKVSYAYGSFEVGYSDSSYDAQTDAGDQDVKSYKVSYTMTDNFSVAYGEDEISLPKVADDQDITTTAITASYTTGGMTLGVMVGDTENNAHGTSASEDKEMWHLTASFAF